MVFNENIMRQLNTFRKKKNLFILLTFPKITLKFTVQIHNDFLVNITTLSSKKYTYTYFNTYEIKFFALILSSFI